MQCIVCFITPLHSFSLMGKKRKICTPNKLFSNAQMYGSDSKGDQFEIWIDSQYPFSDTDHNQASCVNSNVWVAKLTFNILKSKTCLKRSNYKKIGINMNQKNATHVKAFTTEDSDLILRLMTFAICTSGWMF